MTKTDLGRTVAAIALHPRDERDLRARRDRPGAGRRRRHDDGSAHHRLSLTHPE